MRFLFLIVLLFSIQSQAQLKSYIIGAKGDTLNRVDARGLKQGPWVTRVESLRGERGYEEEGTYVNDIKEGVWRMFSLEGDLMAVENYRFGYKSGRNVYFNYMGELLREESWRAIDPKNPFDTVKVFDVNDPTRVVGTQVVKVEPNSYRHGTWKYYDPQMGTIVKTEEWEMDKPKKKAVAADDDDLAPIDVTGDTADASEKKENKKTVTKPKEVLEFEKKNAGKKKIKVRTGSTGG